MNALRVVRLSIQAGLRVVAAPAVGMVLLAGLPSVVLAETVWDKVARTGVLIAGTSATANPFAYRTGKGELAGYSVEMLRLIEAQLEQDLGRDIELKLRTLPSDGRIPAIESGRVDLVCDASSFTWERERRVDFSVSYGLTGTRLLVRRDRPLKDPENLTGVRVAALPQTTNEKAMRQRNADVVLFQDRRDAYVALAQGEVDALGADGILLEAWLSNNPLADNYELVSTPYSQEGIACMVPENNSDLLDTVNYTLTRYMQDFLDEDPAAVAIFDRWFGPESDVPLTRDLRALVIDNMQLVLDFRESLP